MEITCFRYDEGERNMDCQEFEEAIGSYALGALSEEERLAADAHLAECPKCRRTLEQLQAIMELFPLSVPAVDPPPRLKEQIIARIQADATAQQVGSTLPIMATPPRRRTPWRRVRGSLLAAMLPLLLIIVGGLVFWNLSLNQQIAQLSGRIPAPVTYTLSGTASDAATTGQIIYYQQQNITVLVVHDLPQLSGTQVYQGWLLQGNTPLSIGLFNLENGVATLDFQGNLQDYDTAAISLEHGPNASLNAPKGPVIATASLKRV